MKSISINDSRIECLQEQEKLIALEQSARQKLSELLALMEFEKAKYDIAISTACPGLDYIVVETTTIRTSILAASVSPKAVSNAEKELSTLVESLDNVRQKVTNAVKCYQTSEKAVSDLEMELAKCLKEV
uniref:Condensin complex components subunit n=1 Tax=Solanum tuberosum TaxID=4113 RepID=M1DSJ6_SOLTU